MIINTGACTNVISDAQLAQLNVKDKMKPNNITLRDVNNESLHIKGKHTLPLVYSNSIYHFEFCITDADIPILLLGRTEMNQLLGNWKYRLLTEPSYLSENRSVNHYNQPRYNEEKITRYPCLFNTYQQQK